MNRAIVNTLQVCKRNAFGLVTITAVTALTFASGANAQSAAVQDKQKELVDPYTYEYWNDQVVQHCQREPITVDFNFESFTEEQLLSRRRLPEDACKQVIAATGALCRMNESFVSSTQSIETLVCYSGSPLSLEFDAESGELHFTFDDEQPGDAYYNTVREWLETNL